MTREQLDRGVQIAAESEESESSARESDDALAGQTYLGLMARTVQSSVDHIYCRAWARGILKQRIIDAVRNEMKARQKELQEQLESL